MRKKVICVLVFPTTNPVYLRKSTSFVTLLRKTTWAVSYWVLIALYARKWSVRRRRAPHFTPSDTAEIAAPYGQMNCPLIVDLSRTAQPRVTDCFKLARKKHGLFTNVFQDVLTSLHFPLSRQYMEYCVNKRLVALLTFLLPFNLIRLASTRQGGDSGCFKGTCFCSFTESHPCFLSDTLNCLEEPNPQPIISETC
ncbi:hypothetical protein CRM22_008261 [Opisthorchis felineus]|uniref:Uncharacterized protein n=1 Tax=Opisthorchis felineus TaxID=147828 RepID=A0A4S2LE53_OPIFE|nr:hypothetical protein CRM22_008261 [Opisthorchis felineus]